MTLSFKEDLISQIPAIKLLQNVGWEYLSREEVESLRGGGRTRDVILEPVLREQISKINSPSVNGVTSEKFSADNIDIAIERLKTPSPPCSKTRLNGTTPLR